MFVIIISYLDVSMCGSMKVNGKIVIVWGIAGLANWSNPNMSTEIMDLFSLYCKSRSEHLSSNVAFTSYFGLSHLRWYLGIFCMLPSKSHILLST